MRTCLYAQSKLLSLVPFFGHFCTVFISLIHPELCEPATLSLNALQSWEQVHKSALLCRTQKDGGEEEEVGVSTAFKPYSDSVSLRVKFTRNFTILKWSSNIEIGQCSQLTDPTPLQPSSCLFCLHSPSFLCCLQQSYPVNRLGERAT